MLLSIACGLTNSGYGQITIPYYNYFDNIVVDTVGWSHYAISGIDNWEIGVPSDNNFNGAMSTPNSWVTDLDTNYSLNSVMALESPIIDLSDTTINFYLSFFHKKRMASGTKGVVQYSIDSGINWALLNGTTNEKNNWYNSAVSFTGNFTSGFMNSTHSLKFLKGLTNVKVRFVFTSGSSTDEGWLIDNFSILQEYSNIYAQQGDSILGISKYFPDIPVKSSLGFVYQYPAGSINNNTEYYFSKDTVLDPSDTLLGNKSSNLSGSISTWSKTLNMAPNLNKGIYYILYKHDSWNNLDEINENDNINNAVLQIDSTFYIPEYKDNFESIENYWKTYAYTTQTQYPKSSYWKKGNNTIPQIDGTHSEINSWYISQGPVAGLSTTHLLESPYLDMRGDSGNVVCFWYKMRNEYSTNLNTFVKLSKADRYPSYTASFPIPNPRFDNWDCKCYDISYLDGQKNGKIAISLESYQNYTNYADNINVDDIYIGQPKPDLSIEHTATGRTYNSSNIDTMRYMLFNSGAAIAGMSQTEFYWSNDTILDVGDSLIVNTAESTLSSQNYILKKAAYTKPTLNLGTYYIIYKVDTKDSVNEMREFNNIGFFKIIQDTVYGVPYFNDFETQINGWEHNSTIGSDDWAWATPGGTILNMAFSGQKAFVTGQSGILSPSSRMHLYTPAFDLTTLTNPVIEFDMKLDSDGSCSCFNAKTNMSYSIDGGLTWEVLDTTNQSYKGWYYPMEYESNGGIDKNYYQPNTTILLFGAIERTFINYTQYQSRNSKRGSRYIIDIGHLKNSKSIRFRFNTGTTTQTNREGALIDNFRIAEKKIDLEVEYKKNLMISSMSNEIKFFMDVKNNGNYISNPSIVKYYVSNDTILDGSDYYLGQETNPGIRPDMSCYINTVFNAPTNLSTYKYLIFELDATNTNIELNESNNIGYWNLALDSIYSYPYSIDFNDTIVNGWHHYVKNNSGTHLKNQYRFRNMVAPGEPLYQSGIQSKEMFTDRINGTLYISQVPYWYLETPAFNFNKTDSIFLSFDLMCTGKNSGNMDGGNMQFSIDGGNTWTVLTAQYGQAYNWYFYSNFSNLNNEPGWTGYHTTLDSTAFDLSFLKGKENVVFRYKYRSNVEYGGGGTQQGMRIDNFKIEGFKVDYKANDSLVPISATIIQPDFNINYSITSAGQFDGRITKSKFFWSSDSILDNNDPVIHTITENPILSGTTLYASATITYPVPISQTTYYLFYITDADSNLTETNEYNNIGSFKITFPAYVNYFSNVQWDTIYAVISQPSLNITSSIVNNGLLNGVNSIMAFYWSNDSVFDGNDQNIYAVNVDSIAVGDTLISVVTFNYPTPINQQVYYLFYKADNSNIILETNENDNIAAIKIIFDYNNSVGDLICNNIDMFTNGKDIFINSPTNNNSLFNLAIVNSNGQTVYRSKIILDVGLNKFCLPNSLASGIYLINISNGNSILTRKIVIPK